MIQSVITLVAHLKRAGLLETQALLLRDFIEEFSAELLHQVELGQAATDADYLTFQRTVNANTKSGAQIRHTILLRKMFARHPSLFSSMSKAKELDASLRSAIERDAAEVRHLIKTINDSYAASSGGDLFKLTNKTVPAMTGLHANLTSFDDYKTWVESLYFIFRESVGQRMDSNLPTSFADVNSLRTFLQHDVDHGKGAAAKRKKLAAVFESYSGHANPETFPPEQFALVQANVLAALVADLRALPPTLE